MSLSIEHLEIAESALDALMGISSDSEPEEGFGDCIRALRAEYHRRKHGPFTLAEAVASGRPFRRKGWAPLSWARISEHVYNGGALIVFVVGGSAIPVGPNDITACDYELMPEGGE